MFENIIIAIDYYSGFISKDVLFWTFSTIVQSFVAFVALLGMVTIYRIQIVRRNTEFIAESMRDLVRQIRGKEALGYTVDKIVKDIEGLNKIRSDLPQLTRANLELENLKTAAIKVKKDIKTFLTVTILLLVISLILLPLSPYLENSKIGLLFLIIIILWSIFSFYLGFKLMKKLI